MNRNNIRYFLWTVCFLLLTACSDSQYVGPTKAVSIAVSTTPLSAPVYVAQKKGYFKKYGLDVTLKSFHGGHKCLKAVLADKVDYATTSDYPVMLNSFKRTDFEIIATFVSSDNDVKMMANKRSAISTPEDIKGKRVGVVKGASSHYFLDRFLLFNDMQLDDVDLRHISPENMPDALVSAEVDAIAVWEPYGYLTSKKMPDDLLLFPAKDYYRETFNIVAKKDTIAANVEVPQRMILALREAEAFIQSSPIEAQRIVVKELGVDEEFILWIWNDFSFKLSLDQTLLLTLENEARWAIENGIVNSNKTPNYLEFVNPLPIKSVDSKLSTIVQ
jgi:NitT/TauT family transport system substrate-binding protein